MERKLILEIGVLKLPTVDDVYLATVVRNAITEVPAICYSKDNHEFFGYVMFIRRGLKWATVVVDEDLLNYQSDKEAFLYSEAKCVYDQCR